MRTVADVVIAGAGAAGLATAYFLKQLLPNSRIVLVSRHAPFALTSSASTECFRDYWSAPVMRAFMRRSVRLIDEFACSSSENQARISLSRTGYLYAHQHPQVTSVGEQCSVFQQSELLELYPWLSSRCTGGVLAKNAGWLSAHGLGMALLSSLQGSTMMIGWDFVGAMGTEDRIQGVRVRSISTKEELQISCGAFVNATGPSLSATHQCALESLSSAVNAPLPVHNDLHAKVIMHDVLSVIPRSAPMTILSSPTQVPYDDESLHYISECRGERVAAALQRPMPPGAHLRVWGGERSNVVLLLWEAWHSLLKGHFEERASSSALNGSELPLSLLDHDLYPDVVLRALSVLVPDLQQYWNGAAGVKFPKPAVDGGYYTRTPENLPLIGPAPLRGGSSSSHVEGMYICGALSGYGIMGAMASGELCAKWIDVGPKLLISDSPLKEYAASMSPARYGDRDYTRPGGAMEIFMRSGDSLTTLAVFIEQETLSVGDYVSWKTR